MFADAQLSSFVRMMFRPIATEAAERATNANAQNRLSWLSMAL